MSEKEKDFVKFMRHFCTRLVQSVVQVLHSCFATCKVHIFKYFFYHSTNGSNGCCSLLLATPETPDWFNLIVDEIGEIAAYMKSGIKNYPPKCSALSLDFLLHTADGDSAVGVLVKFCCGFLLLSIEVFCRLFRVDRNQLDENVNVHTALYHQMSTLLKSVIMVPRFTPSYRYYVRKQSPETFVLFYRVFEGEPDLSLLGEEQKTKMEITPAPYIEPIIVTPEIKNEQSGENVLFNQASIPYYGNAVPARGSTTVAVSPVTDDINSFSTSPLSNDLPFVESKSHFKLADQLHQPMNPLPIFDIHQEAANLTPIQTALRLRAAFPRGRLAIDRCNKFSRSQLLPKVPEDAVVLHSSKSDRGLDSRVVQKKRFSSLSSESAPFLARKARHWWRRTARTHNLALPIRANNLWKILVVLAVLQRMKQGRRAGRRGHTLNTTKDDEDDRMSSSSNDSYEYVKVIGFASTDKLRIWALT
uniref:Uncharacterized protein n=1 Tax=Ditylenchus dipsaci TaxID=166011 RepID=A0A915EQM8_9BILA